MRPLPPGGGDPGPGNPRRVRRRTEENRPDRAPGVGLAGERSLAAALVEERLSGEPLDLTALTFAVQVAGRHDRPDGTEVRAGEARIHDESTAPETAPGIAT